MTERIPMPSTLTTPVEFPAQRASRTVPSAGSAHAKAILLGEHSVVYGAPAIALPLPDLRADVVISPRDVPGVRLVNDLFTGDIDDAPTSILPVVAAMRAAFPELPGVPADVGLEVRITSAIPYGRGLGSSAAVAAAAARASAAFLGLPLSADRCHEIVQASERVAHGNPSGLDARAVVADTVIRFERGVATPLPVTAPISLVVADSGVRGSTVRAVDEVRRRREAEPRAVDTLVDRLAETTTAGIGDLAAGDLPALGRRMDSAHEVLTALGVSNERLDALVGAATAAGALGAKLTGGGLGGCVLALADGPDDADRLAAALRAAGAPRTWITTAPVG